MAEARPSNKWRLHFNGKTNKDGVYVIKVIPEDGEEVQIRVRIGTDDFTVEVEAAVVKGNNEAR